MTLGFFGSTCRPIGIVGLGERLRFEWMFLDGRSTIRLSRPGASSFSTVRQSFNSSSIMRLRPRTRYSSSRSDSLLQHHWEFIPLVTITREVAD